MSEEKIHSEFGGSSASRWMNCPGSYALCKQVPKRPSSAYAAEGSAAHTLAEICLKNWIEDARHAGGSILKDGTFQPTETFHGVAVTEAMCEAVNVYLDAVYAELKLTDGAELFVEQGFVIDVPSAEPGEVFGTNDAAVYHPSTGRLRIFDYKHGAGVSVSADDNPQLKFYATGAVFSQPWKLSEVILTVVQPRALDADDVGAVKDWTFDTIDLLEFQGDLDKAIERAKIAEAGVSKIEGDGWNVALKIGSWCRWCDAAAICPAKEREALEGAGLDFASVTQVTIDDLPDPKTLDVERLSRTVAGLQLISDWLGQCQQYLEGLVLGGVDVPGWKAVEKIGRAKWVEDPNEIVAYAEMLFGVEAAQLMPPKLTTIGDAQKLLKAAGAKKEQIDDFLLKFTIKESSGVTIAPTSDRRPAINVVAQDFASVNV